MVFNMKTLEPVNPYMGDTNVENKKDNENLKSIKEILKNTSSFCLKKKNKDYKFHLFSFGERGTNLDYKTIKEIATAIIRSIKKLKINYSIVSPEPGGNPWGLLASFLLRKNLKIIRTSYIPGSKKVKIENNYSSHYLYFHNINFGETVIVIDDVISSGNTMRAILKGLKNLNCKIPFIQVIAVKGENYKSLIHEFNIPIKYIIKIR